MSKELSYYIGKRPITSGGKTHSRNKVVTPEIMGLSADEFKDLVKAEKVKVGEPPVAEKKTPADAQPKQPREVRIAEAIKSLHSDAGEPLNPEDFTGDGRPSCDALNAIALLPDEDFIGGDERDAAWEKYQADKAAQ